MASSENVPGPNTPSDKDLTNSGANSTSKNGGIDVGDFSSWNPLNNGGNTGLPKSVSSPL